MTINRERHYAIAEEALAGRVKAHAKHGENSIEAISGRDPRWLSILVEEVGETSHELTYDSKGDLRAELMDVITVAMAWVDSLDRESVRIALAHHHARVTPPAGDEMTMWIECPECESEWGWSSYSHETEERLRRLAAEHNAEVAF